MTAHVALVTGGSRGIGRAIAHQLAKAGAAVLVAARGQEACTEVADEIVEAGGRAWPLYVDVGDHRAIASAIEEARELTQDVGPIDWLVNNAGIAISAPFLEHGRAGGEDLYAKHMDVDFHGPRRLVEALVPDMLARKYGRVVHVASSAGLEGYAYAAAYCASKHALVGYARSAAKELEKRGVTMNLVCPHYVDSPMTDESVRRVAAKTKRTEADARAWFAAQNPGGTLIAPEEVAETVLVLLRGEKNGAIAELVGGRGARTTEATVRWR